MLPREQKNQRSISFSSHKNSSGQALLLVLLGMAVTLTIVMSVVSRSITDISLSLEDEESARAFSAAEAGVEKALIIGTTVSSEDVGYTATVTNIAEDEAVYNIGDLESGETATVWFVSHDTDGNLTCSGATCFSGDVVVCWGEPGSSSSSDITPAMELITYYDTTLDSSLGSTPDYSNIEVARFAFDPWSSRADDNNFTSASLVGCSVGDGEYAFSANIDLNSLVGSGGRLLFAKVKLLYNYGTDNVQPVGVKTTSGSLPSQGLKIESVGTSGVSTRKVEALRPYKETLSIFEAGLFSSGSGKDLLKSE